MFWVRHKKMQMTVTGKVLCQAAWMTLCKLEFKRLCVPQFPHVSSEYDDDSNYSSQVQFIDTRMLPVTEQHMLTFVFIFINTMNIVNALTGRHAINSSH